MSQPATAPLPWNVKLLGLASLLNDTASEMLAPLLPEFLIGVLGGTKTQLGLIDGVGETIASVLKLLSGGWSDQLARRKPLVVFGYVVAAVTRPFIGLATAPWHLFALRAIDRTGKGIRSAPRDALIADSTPPAQHGRAFGFHRAMDHLGAAIGPCIAFGFLLVWPGQLRWLFLLTLVASIPLVFLVVLGLREEPHAPQPGQRMVWSLRPFSSRFRWYLLTLLVFTLGNSSDSFLLVRAKELGIGTIWLPILWFVFHLAKSGGNLLCGGLVDKIGPRPLIIGGWILYAGVYLAFGLATSAWHIWALFLVYALFYALTEPAEKALVAVLVEGQRKGLAYGWFNLTIGIAALPASLAFGAIYDRFGSFAAFATGAGLALVAATLLATVVRPQNST